MFWLDAVSILKTMVAFHAGFNFNLGIYQIEQIVRKSSRCHFLKVPKNLYKPGSRARVPRLVHWPHYSLVTPYGIKTLSQLWYN